MSMIGKSLVHYEITAEIGKGGMGEVYKARDTRLERIVAVLHGSVVLIVARLMTSLRFSQGLTRNLGRIAPKCRADYDVSPSLCGARCANCTRCCATASGSFSTTVR